MIDIEISDEAYQRLEKLKRENETFSDLVIRLTEKAKDKQPRTELL